MFEIFIFMVINLLELRLGLYDRYRLSNIGVEIKYKNYFFRVVKEKYIMVVKIVSD